MNKILNLKEQIEKYIPYNEQEKSDKEIMLKSLEIFDDMLTRENKICHFTASNWIVNKERTKVLMIYHNIYKSWSWTGGHADGDNDLLYVAQKETREETSLQNFKVINPLPISVEILPVKSHTRKGKYIPAHQHFNITYLFEADENEMIRIKEDENSGVKWINLDEVEKYSSEEKMKPITTKKIGQRLIIYK